MSTPTASPVAAKMPEFQRMEDYLEITETLMAGTKAMRSKGERMMPRFPAEDPKVYQARLSTATLRPAYKRTVQVLAGKPMSKRIALEDNVDERTRELLNNVDRAGRNLDTFVADALERALAHGQVHIFIDAPKGNPNASLAEEKKLGLRPYFVMVNSSQVLGYQLDEYGRLSQVRFKEKVTDNDGEFGVKEVDQIKVIERGKWTTYRQKMTEGVVGEWMEHESGLMTWDGVPWVTIFGRRVGFMSSEPPMMELAYLNVKHWQSQSDQDNITHVVRVPILAAIGVDSDFKMVVGAQAAVKLPQGAALQFVEHTGAAITAGKISLDDLVEEMRQAGAEMLMPRGAAATATEVATDNTATMSDLQRIVLAANDALNEAVRIMCEWGKAKTTKVKLHSDFDATFMIEQNSTLVLSAVNGGLLSKETGFKELQRRGIVSGDIDFEEEQARIENEGPPEGKIDPATGLPYKEPAPPRGAMQ